MITVNVMVAEKPGATRIMLGQRGESGVREVVFDVSHLIQRYGAGTCFLVAKRPDDPTAYPVTVEQEDGLVTWSVTNTDTVNDGRGEVELFWYVDGALAKSLVYTTVIGRDVVTNGEDAPDPYESWLDTLTGLAADTYQNASDAAQSAADAAAVIDDVEAAGATQIGAIEDKGEEVLDSIPEDYSDLQEDVDELKSQIDTKIGFVNVTYKTMFGLADVYSSTNIAKTRRWFVKNAFTASSTIGKVSFAVSQDNANTKTQYVEIWEENNGTLTKVQSQSFDVTPSAAASGTVRTYNADFDYVVQTKAYVAFCSVTNTAIPYTVDADGIDHVLVSTDVDPTTDTIALSSLSTFSIKLIPSISISYTAISGVNVKLIGDGMDYEEIQDALLDITDDSASNPYTLLVMPKGTPYEPFTMVRNSFSDTYPWSGITPRHISIIGIDKEHCVIRSDSGNYKLPCGEPLTNGVIKNLKFVMTNDEQDPNATQGGYCLHIDCKPLNDVGYKMLIEDCDFEDASGPCLGIGVHANCDLQIRRCRFNTSLSANYNPHEGYTNLVDYGALFCHSSTSATAPNQQFTLEDCVGVCAEGDRALRINATTQYDPSTSSFVYTLLRNVFWNKALAEPGYQISSSLTANPMNYGNNDNA